jgi:hypothetical protein
MKLSTAWRIVLAVATVVTKLGELADAIRGIFGDDDEDE